MLRLYAWDVTRVTAAARSTKDEPMAEHHILSRPTRSEARTVFGWWTDSLLKKQERWRGRSLRGEDAVLIPLLDLPASDFRSTALRRSPCQKTGSVVSMRCHETLRKRSRSTVYKLGEQQQSNRKRPERAHKASAGPPLSLESHRPEETEDKLASGESKGSESVMLKLM